MKLTTARKYRKSHRFWRDLLTDSPALVLGVDFPFLIVCTGGLKNAVALSIMMFFVHTVTMLVARTLTIRLPLWLRAIANVCVSTAMMLVSREIVVSLFPNIMNLVGIYLYLMSVNGLTLILSNDRGGPSRPGRVLARALVDCCAFTGLMLAISVVREYLGNGTLWGLPVPIPFKQAGMLYPFFGFILTGFLIAFLRKVNKLMVALRIHDMERIEEAYRTLNLKPEAYDA